MVASAPAVYSMLAAASALRHVGSEESEELLDVPQAQQASSQKQWVLYREGSFLVSVRIYGVYLGRTEWGKVKIHTVSRYISGVARIPRFGHFPRLFPEKQPVWIPGCGTGWNFNLGDIIEVTPSRVFSATEKESNDLADKFSGLTRMKGVRFGVF